MHIITAGEPDSVFDSVDPRDHAVQVPADAMGV
jgi:hypothetical protein